MRLPRAFILVGPLLALALAGCIDASDDDPQSVVPEEDPVLVDVVHEAFKGKLVCGLGTPAGTMNPCLLSHQSKNVFPFVVKGGTETLLAGLTWDATILLGEDLQLLVETRGFNTVRHDEAHRYGSASGKADLVVRVDATDLQGSDWSWENLTGLELQARVFPARTMPPNVVVDQAFVLHVVSFHGTPAPEDADPFLHADEARRHGTS